MDRERERERERERTQTVENREIVVESKRKETSAAANKGMNEPCRCFSSRDHSVTAGHERENPTFYNLMQAIKSKVLFKTKTKAQ